MKDKRVRLVYCARCCNMLRDKGLGLLCLSGAVLVPGVTHKVIDVKKTKLCVKENKNNDCSHYTSLVSWRSLRGWKALVRRVAVKRYLKEGIFDAAVQREREELEQARAQTNRRSSGRGGRRKASRASEEDLSSNGAVTRHNKLIHDRCVAELHRGTSDQHEDDSRQSGRSSDSGGVSDTDREERSDGRAVSSEGSADTSTGPAEQREDSTASDSVGSD